MSEATVLHETRGAVALVTLNRPQALNSFTRQMHQDLWAVLDRIEQDKAIRAAVLTGAGRGFCAGADLAEFDFEPGPGLVQRADPGPIIEQAFNPTVRRLMAHKRRNLPGSWLMGPRSASSGRRRPRRWCCGTDPTEGTW